MAKPKNKRLLILLEKAKSIAKKYDELTDEEIANMRVSKFKEVSFKEAYLAGYKKGKADV